MGVAVFHRIGAPDPGTFTNSMEQIRSWSGEKTFDGIYTSVWDHRYELANLDDVWLFPAGDTVGAEGFIGLDELRALVDDFGCRLGWHTWSHPDMRTLTDDQIRRELDAPAWCPRDAFAYPYGDFNDRVIELVKEAGFSKAYSTTQGNSGEFSLYRAYI